MTSHCSKCHVEVEADVTLAPVPANLLCEVCKARPHETKASTGGNVSVEILELGGDGGVLRIGVTF